MQRINKVEAYDYLNLPDIDLFLTHAKDMHLSGFRGQGVVVALTDSGVDTNDPEVMKHVIGGVNISGDGAYTDLHDYAGHGGLVARLIIAHAPDVQLYVVKIFGTAGETEDNIAAQSLEIASMHATIINASWGGPRNAYLDSAIASCEAAGCTIVAAAGNSGDGDAATNEEHFPGSYDYPITIGGIDRGGIADTSWDWMPLRPAAYSSSYPQVDAVAISRVPGTWDAGTSFAAPITAGLLACRESKALLKGTPNTDDHRYQWLLDHTRQLPGMTARNNQTGYGMVTCRPDNPLKSVFIDVNNGATWVDGVETTWVKQPENRPPGEMWFYGKEFAEKSGRRVLWDPNDPRGQLAKFF